MFVIVNPEAQVYDACLKKRLATHFDVDAGLLHVAYGVAVFLFGNLRALLLRVLLRVRFVFVMMTMSARQTVDIQLAYGDT